MPVTETTRQLLYKHMDARRLDLGLTWREFAARAGLSYEAIRALRAGDIKELRDLTARKLDTALGWVPGTAQRILTGEIAEPVPAAQDGTVDRPRFPDDPVMDGKAARIWAARFDNEGRVPGMTDEVTRTIILQVAALEARRAESDRQAG